MRYGVLFLAAVAALAQTNPAVPKTVPNSVLQPSRESLSDMASRMLERTLQARAALDKDPAQARHFVEEALQNITAMQIDRPNAPRPFMVTLYTESVEITVNKPQPVGSATQGAANRSENPTPVQQVTGESTRVSVNVTQAQQQLQAARNDIDKGDLSGAKQSLAAVDNDLKAESAVGDLPLIKARENLALALTDVREKRYADSVVPLRAASAGLGDYARGQSGHAHDAAKLRSDIDALAATIPQDHAGADSKIAGWRNEISRWIQPLSPPPVKH